MVLSRVAGRFNKLLLDLVIQYFVFIGKEELLAVVSEGLTHCTVFALLKQLELRSVLMSCKQWLDKGYSEVKHFTASAT